MYDNAIGILACDAKWGIGRDNSIPWYCPEDFKHFKETTYKQIVIMGRKTFESIGKPLPGRVTIVLTRNMQLTAQGVIVTSSPENAMWTARALADSIDTGGERTKIFICGGAEIYKAMHRWVDRYIVTRISHAKVSHFDCDAFFDTSLLDTYRIEKISELEKSKNPGIGFQILHFVDTENPDTDTRITLERHYAR